MSCITTGIIGRIVDRATPAIMQGSDSFIKTALSLKGCDDPYDLSSMDGASCFFISTSGGAVCVTGTATSADRGQCLFPISQAQTALIATGDPVSFEQHFIDDAGYQIIRFDDAIGVLESLF